MEEFYELLLQIIMFYPGAFLWWLLLYRKKMRFSGYLKYKAGEWDSFFGIFILLVLPAGVYAAIVTY